MNHPKLVAEFEAAKKALDRLPCSGELRDALFLFLVQTTTELIMRRDQVAELARAYQGGLIPELASELEQPEALENEKRANAH